MPRAAIIGAGPGGLAAAVALRSVGLESRIYERAPELGEGGSGLTLWPNALVALEALDVADRVRADAAAFGEIAMRSRRGRVLSRTALPDGGEGLALRRGDLVGALRAELGACVELGAACTGFRQDREGVAVTFEDGHTARAECLIGADGLHSRVRAGLTAGSPLVAAGYRVWRGIAALELGDPVGTLSMGRGAQFGSFPMSRGRAYWFASCASSEPLEPAATGWRPALVQRFAAWHAPIPDLIAETDEADIVVTDIYDRDPLERWSHERVTLLGDAAHPAPPTLGQGACQALEDAAALAGAFALEPGPVGALSRYERTRLPRANWLTREARRAGEMGKVRSRVACGLRDVLMKFTPPGVQRRQLRKMFAAAV